MVGANVGDSLLLPPLPMTSLPPPLLLPEDPEPSSLCTSDWIEWCAKYAQTLSWWEELTQVPGHADHKEFAWKVCASFEVLKTCNWVKKVGNYYMPLLATPWSASTISCHWSMWGLPPRTSVSANCSILSLIQELCSIGPRRCILESKVKLTVWWRVNKNAGGQWSCSYASKRKRSSQPWCHPIGWKYPCHSQQRLCHKNAGRATPKAAGPVWEELCLWLRVKAGLLLQPHGLLQQWRHQQLHHGRLGHTSPHLTPGPCVHHPGLQKLPKL